MQYEKLKFVFTMAILLPLLTTAQGVGIKFQDQMSWSEILLKAKTDHKYIFMNCHATWCGPCREMEKNIFPLKQTGDYFNAHFINVSVQMNRASGDSKFVQSWYDDADTLSKHYKIEEFPTYLFFTPEGKIIHRVVGSMDDPKEFIGKGMDALNPEKQYYSLLSGLENHLTDSGYLLAVLNAAKEASDKDVEIKVGNDFIQNIANPISFNNLQIIAGLIHKVGDTGFKLFVRYSKEIDSIMEQSNYAEGKLAPVIFHEEISPLLADEQYQMQWENIIRSVSRKYSLTNSKLIQVLSILMDQYVLHDLDLLVFKDEDIKPNWENLEKYWSAKIEGYPVNRLVSKEKDRYYLVEINLYINKWVKNDSGSDWRELSRLLTAHWPEYDHRQILLYRQILYYADGLNWEACAQAAYLFIKEYGGQLDEHKLNDIIWNYIFQHSKNKIALAEGTYKIRTRINSTTAEKLNGNMLDTYANLLYKTGDSKTAIKWEIRAIEIMTQNKGFGWEESLDAFKITLDKMRKGVKTWEE